MPNESFAFSAPANAPVLEVSDPGRIRAGVVGGPQAQGLDGSNTMALPAPKQDNTMALLMKVGEEVLKPSLVKARTEAYVGGMQRAMQGEAVLDMAQSQPWYTKIFGDSDVVEGARAYAGHTVAQTQAAAMEDQMPELRKLAPDAARQYFVDSVSKNLTGDHPTDLAIMNAMTSALPSVMRRQVKEHYGFKQEVAAQQQATAFRSGSALLQSAAKSLGTGYRTQEEFQNLATMLKQSVQPVDGQDYKGYQTNIAGLLENAAANGQFHALSALTSPVSPDDPTSLLDTLEPDQRTRVEKAIEAGEAKLRTRYSGEWRNDLAAIEEQAVRPIKDRDGVPGQSTNDFIAKIDALNQRYKDETGSRLDLIAPAHAAALIKGSAVAIAQENDRVFELARAEAEKLRKAGLDADAAEAVARVVREQGAAGNLGGMRAQLSQQEIDEVAEPEYRAKGPEQRVEYLAANMRKGHVIDQVRREREGSVSDVLRAGQYTPEVQKVFEDYAALREKSPTAADAYYGKHAAALEGFTRDVANGGTVLGAFRSRFISPDVRPKLGDKEAKAALSVILSSENDFLPAWMGGVRLKPGQDRRILNELGGLNSFYAATGNVKESTTRALHQAKLGGLEILGGYAWTTEKNQRPLSEYLTKTAPKDSAGPIPTDRLNDMFEEAVDELLYGADKSAGILPDTASDIYVGRLPDVGGVPMFHVQSVVDGKPYEGLLAGSAVFELANKRQAQKDAHAKRNPTGQARKLPKVKPYVAQGD